tara:strand:+ start:879 stop:1061 length:183 start_codon:yes stop_codon:yes gene_type:complete
MGAKFGMPPAGQKRCAQPRLQPRCPAIKIGANDGNVIKREYGPAPFKNMYFMARKAKNST